MKKPPFKQKKRVRTSEPLWFQAYVDSCVDVTLSKSPRTRHRWTVSVWGDDDTGMFALYSDLDEARAVFGKITDGVTHAQLQSLGLRSAG